MPADLALCNEALHRIGEAPLQSLDDGSDIAASCLALYDTTINALLASHPWRRTMHKVQLSRLTDAPLTEWTYQHALPADLIALRQVVTSAAIGAPPLLEYEMFEGRILSHAPDLWCDYQRQTPPATWPPGLRRAARLTLAADLAMAVTGSVNLADALRREAEAAAAEARRLDSQQQPPQAITDFPLLAARFGGRA
jgi:hypothetical protein